MAAVGGLPGAGAGAGAGVGVDVAAAGLAVGAGGGGKPKIPARCAELSLGRDKRLGQQVSQRPWTGLYKW